MTQGSMALVKLAIGLLTVGAVTGIAGRLSTEAPGDAGRASGLDPSVRATVTPGQQETSEGEGEDPYGYRSAPWRDQYRLDPAWRGNNGLPRWRARTRAS